MSAFQFTLEFFVIFFFTDFCKAVYVFAVTTTYAINLISGSFRSIKKDLQK